MPKAGKFTDIFEKIVTAYTKSENARIDAMKSVDAEGWEKIEATAKENIAGWTQEWEDLVEEQLKAIREAAKEMVAAIKSV